MNQLAAKLTNDPYQGYAYGYPHKTAYRPLDPPVALKPHWEKEDTSSLFFYLHLPFCEMRCGFCNLFTTTHPNDGLVNSYLDTLERQMEVMSGTIDSPRFAQAAFGGGTPSFLSIPELQKLFGSIEKKFGAFENGIPISFETSPATINPDKLALLRDQGITRLSIGVQSFVSEETKALGRPQKRDTLDRALQQICEARFPVFNIDLIYGVQGQTPQSWQSSLEEAVNHDPQELYLYPLYVRPLTGLGKKERPPSDLRPALYRQAREFLLSRGYEQISMRLFRHQNAPVPRGEGPIHCCQEDGMIGFGAGARSYTRNLHYSTEYAVGRSGIMEILSHYIDSPIEAFKKAGYGCLLTPGDHKRRYLIKSILRRGGLNHQEYHREFGSPIDHDFENEITQLIDCGLAENTPERIHLTPEGFAHSDLVGPWLFSAEVQQMMENYELV